MDPLAKAIPNELFSAEKEMTPPPARPKGAKDALPEAEHWPHAVLLERNACLRERANLGDGQASETLSEYPQHATMLSFRAQNGVAELHENFADLFCVLDGSATLVTGGTVVDPQPAGPGEIRGASLEGGMHRLLAAGDIAHVPAGVPHQMLVPGGKTFTSLVVKIGEKSQME